MGDPEAKVLKRMKKRVHAVNVLQDKYKAVSDSELRKKTDDFRETLKDLKGKELAKKLDELLPEAFSVVRETLGVRLSNVTLMFS